VLRGHLRDKSLLIYSSWRIAALKNRSYKVSLKALHSLDARLGIRNWIYFNPQAVRQCRNVRARSITSFEKAAPTLALIEGFGESVRYPENRHIPSSG
jgi:hypothetical protein